MMTAIEAVNQIVKILVQLIPFCVSSPRLRTLNRYRISKSTVACAI